MDISATGVCPRRQPAARPWWAASPRPASTIHPYLRKYDKTSIYDLTRLTHAIRYLCGAERMPPAALFLQRKDMFLKGLPLEYLPPEARQCFTHDVDHRLGGPAVATIVEKREGEDLTIYRRDVPSERDDVVGRTGFGVQVPLGWCVPHSASKELGVAGDRKRRMEPRTPSRAMGVAQQLDLGTGRNSIESREPASIGEGKSSRVRTHLAGKKSLEQRTRIRHAHHHIALRTARGVPEEQLGVVIDALAVHRGDHARKRRRQQARDLDGTSRRLAELDATVNLHPARDECVPEGAGREARRVFADVNIFARPRSGSDRAVRDDRPITLFAETEAGAASGDSPHIGDERDGARGRLEHNVRRLAGRRRTYRNGDEILVER